MNRQNITSILVILAAVIGIYYISQYYLHDAKNTMVPSHTIQESENVKIQSEGVGGACSPDGTNSECESGVCCNDICCPSNSTTYACANNSCCPEDQACNTVCCEDDLYCSYDPINTDNPICCDYNIAACNGVCCKVDEGCYVQTGECMLWSEM